LLDRGIEIESKLHEMNLSGREYAKELSLNIKSLEIKNDGKFFIDLNGLFMSEQYTYTAGKLSENALKSLRAVNSAIYLEDPGSKIRMT
jgi:hypothetical protein